MTRTALARSVLACAVAALSSLGAHATPFFFSTGNPDGRIAASSRPDAGGKFEIETADDFVLTQTTKITHATFTGLLTGAVAAPTVGNVTIEIYRVFPLDSDTGRTIGVPTRVNSPSDVAFDSRDAASSGLNFSTTTLTATFTALNSVQPGGIHPLPNPTTGGNGAVTGMEVRFDIDFILPLLLDDGHYFFVPQVELSSGDFLWLSAPKPILAPGTPFAPDLQAWTRDEGLDPDWLRIGTDIVGPSPAGGPAPTFNASFSLVGESVPEPGSAPLLGLGLIAAWGIGRRRCR